MAKLAIIAALLVALVAVASAYTTTITTTIVEDKSNPRGDRGSQQQRCRQQFDQQQQLSHCQMYLRQGSPYEDDVSLRMVVNPQQQQQQQQHRRQCCQQLENIDEKCRCESIRQMVRQQQQEGQMGGQEMQQMAQKAMNLPRTCNMEPQQCQIRAVFY